MNAERSARAVPFGTPGWRQIGAAHHPPREDQLEDLLLVLGLGEVHDQRNVGRSTFGDESCAIRHRLVVDPLWVATTLDHDQPAAALHLAAPIASVTSLPPDSR
jgi:hypothetical protein